MKKITLTCLMLMFMGSLFAQWEGSYYYPQWNTGAHANNAFVTCNLYIDDEIVTTTNYEIGAFNVQDDAICGAGMVQVSPNYTYPFYQVCYKGESNDEIHFMLYNHATGEPETSMMTETVFYFVADDNIGGLASPFQMKFYTVKNMVFEGLEDNLWSNAANWTADGEPAGRLPQAFEDVTIAAPCLVDMEAVAATVTVTTDNYLMFEEDNNTLTAEIIVQDGGQLFPISDITATFEKQISANDWYMMSIPVQNTDFEGAGMLVEPYDLYRFDQMYFGSIDEEEDPDYYMVNGEWRNYKYYINGGTGYEGEVFTEDEFINATFNAYLYANGNETTLNFNGAVNSTTESNYTIEWEDNGDPRCQGFSMVGNPFPCNAQFMSKGGSISNDCFILNNNELLISDLSQTILPPATSMFVIANTKGARPTARAFKLGVAFPDNAKGRSVGAPCINIEVLSNNGVLEDRAYMNMEDDNVTKISLKDDGTKIYIPQNGKRYAAAYVGEAKAMPLCFNSTEGGIHTISVKAENMNCSYLHLIDNVTGADIDLLRTPKYSFNANDSHYATRFKLVFDESATNEIVDSFAFISNGELMITNNGEATLQVMDITGRILSTEHIQNCYSKSLNLSAGVYVVRLSNGNDVKAQKIVVE